jgi:hypothetical protein
MRIGVTKPALFLLVLSLACAVPQLLAKKKEKVGADASANEQKRAVHALNRLTFGPRPGDVERVMAMGVDRWIDLQLHPEKISDNAVESRLAQFRTLHMSAHEMVAEFPDNQMVKQVMDGKKPMPSDPAKRAIYVVQVARMEDRQEKKERREEAAAAPARPPVSTAEPPAMANPGDAAATAKTQEELAAAAAAASSS